MNMNDCLAPPTLTAATGGPHVDVAGEHQVNVVKYTNFHVSFKVGKAC